MHSQTDLISFIANQHLHTAAVGGVHLQLIQPFSQSCESVFSCNIIHWEQRKRSLTAVEPWTAFPSLWQNLVHPHFLTTAWKKWKVLGKEASATHSSQSWNTLGCAHPKSLQDYRTQAPLRVKIKFTNRNILPVGSAELGHTEYFKIGILSPNFMYKYMHTLLLKTWTELKATFRHWQLNNCIYINH